MDAEPQKHRKKTEPVIMSPDMVIFFRESLAEIRSDVKEIKREFSKAMDDVKDEQIRQAIELERQKWKHGIMSTLAGAVSGIATSIGLKLAGFFS